MMSSPSELLIGTCISTSSPECKKKFHCVRFFFTRSNTHLLLKISPVEPFLPSGPLNGGAAPLMRAACCPHRPCGCIPSQDKWLSPDTHSETHGRQTLPLRQVGAWQRPRHLAVESMLLVSTLGGQSQIIGPVKMSHMGEVCTRSHRCEIIPRPDIAGALAPPVLRPVPNVLR